MDGRCGPGVIGPSPGQAGTCRRGLCQPTANCREMKRRTTFALAAVALLAAGAVGVRVADPLASPPDGPAIDLSDAPAEVAFAAMKSTEHRDFTVERYVGETTNET